MAVVKQDIIDRIGQRSLDDLTQGQSISQDIIISTSIDNSEAVLSAIAFAYDKEFDVDTNSTFKKAVINYVVGDLLANNGDVESGIYQREIAKEMVHNLMKMNSNTSDDTYQTSVIQSTLENPNYNLGSRI